MNAVNAAILGGPESEEPRLVNIFESTHAVSGENPTLPCSTPGSLAPSPDHRLDVPATVFEAPEHVHLDLAWPPSPSILLHSSLMAWRWRIGRGRREEGSSLVGIRPDSMTISLSPPCILRCRRTNSMKLWMKWYIILKKNIRSGLNRVACRLWDFV